MGTVLLGACRHSNAYCISAYSAVYILMNTWATIWRAPPIALAADRTSSSTALSQFKPLTMLFQTSVIALLFATVSSTSWTPSGDIPATSRLGQRLLSTAKVVEPARQLEDRNDMTFVAKYSLKYLGCSSLVTLNAEGNRNDGGMLMTQNLVRFALCPSSSCGSCSGGGEYVTSMNEFVDAYTEEKLTEKEYACEMVRESCYCDNANDDEACENQCYIDANMSDCIQYEGQDEFNIQEYLECRGTSSIAAMCW